ncbi:hypothetical protein NDU88_009498 [Pleurodeles waltl]|uniref:Uncharacterized protein n=1 Tax=Pleurodeles waltl TaxID=8319 RepID=A0AAV7PW02_PLEWA|nr:hypothetical protein NDU88_009498 [Pleurodeles waltl]
MSCSNPVGDAGKFLLHGRRCIDYSSQEVGLRRSVLAMRRSSGPCDEFPVAMLALRSSPVGETGLRHSGLACGDFLTVVQAVH